MEKEEEGLAAAARVERTRNPGEPLRFKELENLAGFAAQAGKGGDQIKILTKLALASDQPLFHRLAESFADLIHGLAQKAGVAVRLNRAETVLLVIRPDNTAELWVDMAAVNVRCMLKRAVKAGEAIFDNDIADVTGMMFPHVEIAEKDKVLCLFREAWRFGFAFDMNPDGKLDLDGFVSMLGTLHRELRYWHLYETMADEVLFARLVGAGWFPFVEIIATEFKDLVRQGEAGFDLAEVEPALLARFDEARLQHILSRWLAKKHFLVKGELLKEAIEAFVAGKPATVLKILLTEIEGILNDAHRAAHGGQGAKLKQLLKFAEASGAQRAGRPDTLFFPAAFGRYLAQHTFANFDPAAQTGTAGSRHAVGHGAAAQDTYTMPRALQAILTLDQLAFYT